jgi:hypothetical protein
LYERKKEVGKSKRGILMIKEFCDCCGKEIEHINETIRVEYFDQGSFQSSSGIKSIYCNRCKEPIKKILKPK